MKLDGATTNIILSAADFEPEPSDWARLLAGQPPRTIPGHFGPQVPPSPDDLCAAIADHSWPCLIVDARCHILGGNRAAERVLGLDLRDGVQDPRRQHLVRFVLSREARERIVNWEEAVTALVPSTLRRALTGDRVPPSLRPLVEQLTAEEPDVLRELQELWREAPAPVLTGHAVVPLVWQHSDGAVLAFHVVLDPPLGSGAPWVIDWHPADAVTWQWLGPSTL